MQRKIFVILISFIFAIIICGASSAAANGTANDTQNSSVCVADPVINGTVTINEYGRIRPLQNATVVINTTGSNSRVLGSAITDSNGYYSISFFSTDTQFKVTAGYVGCNPVINNAIVTLNNTDGISYGTSNFQLTPLIAYWDGTYGYAASIYITHYNDYYTSGELNTRVQGNSNTYKSYCIDIYTAINANDQLLVNGPLPGTSGDLNQQIDWGKVTYIINHYIPTNDNEGAAIQCAIWALTTVQYPDYNQSNPTALYHFLTAPNDALLDTKRNKDAVRIRALQILSEVNSMLYPYYINLDPQTIRLPNGGSTTLTATVTDRNGNKLSGIQVNFTTSNGNLSRITGTTDSNGQITTILSGTNNNVTAVVTAAVIGNYGNLLYDNSLNPKQNLAAVKLLPYALSDFSFVNFDSTANVELTQTVTTPVNVGEQIIYTITARNTGPNTATGIMINDLIPAGFTATPSAGTSFLNGVWIIPSLTNGASATLIITGTATTAMAGLNITNTATRIAQDQYNSLSNSTSATVHVKKADVAISQTVNGGSSATINVNDTITYIITAINNGPDAATGLQIKDLLPTGFIFQSANTHGAGTYNNNTGIWNIGTLNNGTIVYLTITGLAGSNMAGLNLTNYANRTAQIEYNSLSNTTNTTVYTKLANVALSQTVNGGSSATVNVGDAVNFVITATNNGPDVAHNIRISDLVPAGLTDVIVTASSGTSYSGGVWTINSLATGALNAVTLTISGKAGSSMAGYTTTNTATRTGQDEYNSLPTVSAADVYTKKADLTITNTANNSSLNVGQTGTFTVTVTNHGPNTATNIKINDLLPNGFTAGTPTVGNYNGNIWTIDNLASGSLATLTFTATLTPSMAGSNITNNGNAIWDEYPQAVSIPDATIHVKEANVTITNTANQNNLNVGDTAVFTVSVTNNGEDAATNIRINAPLPAEFTTDTHGVGSYDGTVWIIDSLAKGSTATLTFTGVLQNATAGTNITNHVTETQDEYPFTVNVPDANIYVKKADVSLNQTGSYSGNKVTFIVTATNNGPDTATNINIRDIIPTGLTGIIVTPSVGTYDSFTGIWFIPILANGESVTLNIIGNSTPQNTINNTATKINQTEYDPNTPDNTVIGVYVPQVDIYLQNYPWWYNSDIKDQQYQYVCGNAPVITADIQNIGPDDASGVTVEYIIPSGLKYEGYSVATGTVTYENGKLIWDIGYLPKGGRLYLKVFVRIIGTGNQTPNVTTLFNVTHVDQLDTNSTNNNATCALIVNPAADIGVTQTQQLYTENGTQYVKYTITVVNNGPNNSTGVQIKDILPTGVVWDSDNSGGTYNHNTSGTGAGIWNIGTFNYGDAPKTLEIIARVTGIGTIKNTASKNAGSGYDWNTGNNAQTCTINPSNSTVNLYLQNYPWWYNSDIKDQQYQYVCGNAPVITADIQNIGPDDASGVTVEYIIPSGLKYEGYSVATGTVTYENGKLIWDIGYLPKGGRLYLKVFVRIIGTGNQTPNVTTLFNVTHVDQLDTNSTNNNATCALIVNPAADIGVTQTQQLYTENGTQYVKYTITVVNNGPNNSTGVQIKDILPTGVVWDSDNSGGTYNHNTSGTGAGIWNIGTFNYGDAPKTLEIIARVTGIGTIKNTASKNAGSGYDWNTGNNAQTCTISIP